MADDNGGKSVNQTFKNLWHIPALCGGPEAGASAADHRARPAAARDGRRRPGGAALRTAAAAVFAAAAPGAQAAGLLANGGSLSLANSVVDTQADGAYAAEARNGGALTLTDAALATQGKLAHGAVAGAGSTVTLVGGSVTTANPTGKGTQGGEARAYALYAHGAGASIDAAGTALHGVGQRSYGAYAIDGGAITLTGGSVLTEGFMGYGVYASGAGSTVTTHGVDITTTGQVGDAVWAYDGGAVHLDGGTLLVQGGPNPSPSGETANGMTAAGGGVIHADGIALMTQGAGSAGALVGASVGSGRTWGEVHLSDSSVTVNGEDAVAASVNYGSTFTARDSVLVSARGAGLELSEGATVVLENTTVRAARQSIVSFLSEAGAAQEITVAAGSALTENDGTLLQVERSEDGGGAVVLDLQAGSVSSGRIVDNLNGVTLEPDGGTYVTVGAGASFTGKVVGVRDFRTLGGDGGQTLTFESGSELGSLTIDGANASTHGGTPDAPIVATGDIAASGGAVLGGNWQIAGTLNTSGGATVSPGNSVGRIRTAQLDWGPGTVYDVEVNAAGDADRIDVTAGGADLSGTRLRVRAESDSGAYRLNHDYTILTATGAIVPFASTEAVFGSPLIDATPAYGADRVTVRLSVDEQALSDLSLTPNQRAASAGALSVAGLNAAADAAFAAAAPQAAFDQLSGEIHAGLHSGLRASADLLPQAVSRRMRDAGSAAAPAGPQLWGQAVGHWQRLDGKDGSASLSQDVRGFFLGGDTAAGGGWRVGGLFGYTNSDLDADSRNSSADVDSYTVGLYGGKGWNAGAGRVNLLLGAGYTFHDIGTRRSVSLGGGQSLKANYRGGTAQVFAQAGYGIPVGQASLVEPYAGIAYLGQHTEGFREHGGSAALRGRGASDDNGVATLGLRGATALGLAGMQATLRAGVGWRHAFGGATPRARLSFVEGAGASFGVAGAPIATDAAALELGAELAVRENVALELGYAGQFGQGSRDHSGNLSLRVNF